MTLNNNESSKLLVDLDKLKQRLDKAADIVKEDHISIIELKETIKDLKSQIVTSTEPTQSKEQDKLFAALIKTKRLIHKRFTKTASPVWDKSGNKTRGDIIDIFAAMFTVESTMVNGELIPNKDAKNALDENNIDIIQEPIECASRDLVKTTVVHIQSGQWRSSLSRVIFDTTKGNPNACFTSGLTIAKRNALAAIFNLHLGEE
jgi:hypothetical protein